MRRISSKCHRPKVLVAMSGGVDSSVAAALLVQKGCDVTGAFMKQWSDSQGVAGLCEWKKDRRDALRVAAHLGVPLLTLDFEKEYRESVATYLFAEYERGRTPNPDVVCNATIKFGAWLSWALAHGFDYLATGHYANIRTTKNTKGTNFESTKCTNTTNLNGDRVTYHLMSAKDANKDQTYFLHQLNQGQLAHVVFPIGQLLKSEVRSFARRFTLPTAEREESMGICFIGERSMKEFLQQKIKPIAGNIVRSSGEVLGTHEGLPFYTIGQRHFGLQTSESGPLYVVEKRMETNELVVGYDDDPLLFKKEIAIANVHWVGHAPTLPLSCEVRLRHRQPLQRCVVGLQSSAIRRQSRHSRDPAAAGQSAVDGRSPRLRPALDGQVSSEVRLQFVKSQRAPTPGQFAVFYLGGECLGGGVIG